MATTNRMTTFGERLYARHSNEGIAFQVAQNTANLNGSPVMILERDGWLAIIEEAPDDAECDPYGNGWTDYALIDPMEVR